MVNIASDIDGDNLDINTGITTGTTPGLLDLVKTATGIQVWPYIRTKQKLCKMCGLNQFRG